MLVISQMNDGENFSLKWDKINLKIEGKDTEYPLLRVVIKGDPSFLEFLDFMGKIESFIKDQDKDYISITDFSNLHPNKAIERAISMSSSKILRSVIFVSNRSKLSFVLLGKDSDLSILKKLLVDANKKLPGKSSYSYNYYFIEEESQMKSIAEKFFNRE